MPGTVSRGLVPAAGKGALSPLGRRILDCVDRGVILLDADGVVLESNSLARNVLGNGNGLQVRGGRMTFADAATDLRFARMLADHGRGVATRVLAAIVRRIDAPSCRVLVSRLGLDHDDAHGVAFVACIYRAAETRDIEPDVLREIYGLTRAQADVARKLYAGRSVARTAAELKLSSNTIRTHLKQIFSKCEVRSQARIAAFARARPAGVLSALCVIRAAGSAAPRSPR